MAASSLADSFFSYLALPDPQLEAKLRSMIRLEDELPEPDRYEATLARLRAWLELSDEDARIIARGWARALATLPADYGQRAAQAERAVIFNGLTFAEFRRLSDLLPSLATDWLPEEVEEPAIATAA